MFDAEALHLGQQHALVTVRRPEIPRMVPASAEFENRSTADFGRRTDLQVSEPGTPLKYRVPSPPPEMQSPQVGQESVVALVDTKDTKLLTRGVPKAALSSTPAVPQLALSAGMPLARLTEDPPLTLSAGMPLTRRAKDLGRPIPQQSGSRSWDPPTDTSANLSDAKVGILRPTQSGSHNIQRHKSWEPPIDTSLTSVRPKVQRQSSHGTLQAASVQRSSNGDLPSQAGSLTVTIGRQRQLRSDPPAEVVAPPSCFPRQAGHDLSGNAWITWSGPRQQSISLTNVRSQSRSDGKTSLPFSDRTRPEEVCSKCGRKGSPGTSDSRFCAFCGHDSWQPQEEVVNGDTKPPTEGGKHQLLKAMERVAEQARLIAELKDEVSEMQEFKAEARERSMELEQLRMQVSSTTREISFSAPPSEPRCLNFDDDLALPTARTLLYQEIEELRSLQSTMAPISELQEVQEECRQLVAERELIHKHVLEQQAEWDQILQSNSDEVTEQAQQISELQCEASKTQAFKAELRDTATELDTLRMQLVMAAPSQSRIAEDEPQFSNRMRALTTEHQEELRLLQNAMAPLSELRQIKEECSQLVAEREMIHKQVLDQQAVWEQILQANCEEVASALQAVEREQTDRAALFNELQVASERARQAEQAQHSTQSEALEELEVHRAAAQEKAVNMVELHAHLQHLSERQAAIDGLSRDRVTALEEVSQITAESAQVTAQTEFALRNVDKAEMMQSVEYARHEMASLEKSLEAEREKHARLAKEFQISLDKFSQADQVHRHMVARREEALQEREADEAEKEKEMQAFIVQLAARQAAMDDLSRERTATLEQAFQIQAARSNVISRTRTFEDSVAKQQASVAQEFSFGSVEPIPLADELHAALEQVQISRGGGQPSDDSSEFLRDSDQDDGSFLTKGSKARLAQAASEQSEHYERKLQYERDAMAQEREANALEMQAHARQLAEYQSEIDCLTKDRAAALESASLAQRVSHQRTVASLATNLEAEQAAKASLVLQLEDAMGQTKRAEEERRRMLAESEKLAEALAQAFGDRDEVASLARGAEADQAAKASLVQQLEVARQQSLRLEQERDRIRVESEQVVEELQDDCAQMAQQRESYAAEVRLHANHIAEQKAALELLGKKRAAALEEVSEMEARCARAVADRDLVKHEFDEQKAGMARAIRSSPIDEAAKTFKSSLVQQVDDAMERASRVQQEHDKMQAERERALRELQDVQGQRAQLAQERAAKVAEMKVHARQLEEHKRANDGFRKEAAAALEQVSALEAQVSQAAAERDLIRSELSQEQAKAARHVKQVESSGYEAASLAKLLEVEKIARTSIVEKLDATTEKLLWAQQDREVALAEKEQEFKNQGAIQRERTAALERASRAEAKYTHAAAERDHVKHEVAQQRDEAASLSKRLENELHEARKNTFRIEQERDEIRAEREDVRKEYQNHLEKMAQEREATVAEVQSHVQQMIEQQSTKEGLSREKEVALEQVAKAEAKCTLITSEKDRLEHAIAEQQITMASLVRRLEEQATKQKQMQEQAAALEQAEAKCTKITLEKDRIERAFVEQQSTVTSLTQRLEEQTTKHEQVQEQAAALERALSIESDQVVSAARMQQLLKENRQEMKMVVKRLEEEQTPREFISSEFEANLQRLQSKLNADDSRGGRQGESQSPSKSTGSPDEPRPGTLVLGALKHLDTPQSRSSSQSPRKAIGCQSRSQSPIQATSSQGGTAPGKTSQFVLKALSQASSRGSSRSPTKPQNVLQDQSKGTPRVRDAAQSAGILPPPTARSRENTMFSRKDLQSAQPPPSSKALSQIEPKTPSRAPSTGQASPSDPRSRSESREKAPHGSSLSSKLHDRLNMLTTTPRREETATEATREPVNQFSFSDKAVESLQNLEESPMTDLAISPTFWDKRSVTSAGSDELPSWKVGFGKSVSISGSPAKTAGQPSPSALEMLQLAKEGLDKDTDSCLQRSASRSGSPEKIAVESSPSALEMLQLAKEGLDKDTHSFLQRGRLINSNSTTVAIPSTLAQDTSASEPVNEQDPDERRSSSAPSSRAKVGQRSHGLNKESSKSGGRSWLDAAPGCRSLLDRAPGGQSSFDASLPAAPSVASAIKSASQIVHTPGPRVEPATNSQMTSLRATPTATTATPGSHCTPTRSSLSVRHGSGSVPSPLMSSQTPSGATLGRAISNPRSALPFQADCIRTPTSLRSGHTPPTTGRAESPAHITPRENIPGLPLRMGSRNATPATVRSSSFPGILLPPGGNGGSSGGSITTRRGFNAPPYAFSSRA